MPTYLPFSQAFQRNNKLDRYNFFLEKKTNKKTARNNFALHVQ